jgi:uncharacterized membrane protein YcfT
LSDLKREYWVDSAKGIGIILVVVGHVWRGMMNGAIVPADNLYYALDSAIYVFHMPLFFLLSGLFFEKSILRRGWTASLRTRIMTLLYPLVLWSYVTAAFLLVAGRLTNRGGLSLWDALTYPFPPKDVYWFLGALFAIQLVATLLVATRRRELLLLALAVSIVFVFAIGFSEREVWVRGMILNAPFFFIGMLIPKRMLGSKMLGGMGLAVFAVVEVALVSNPGPLEMPRDFLLSMCASIGFLFAAAWLLSVVSLPYLRAIGMASMAIFVSHVIALAACRIALSKLGIEHPWLHLVGGTAVGVAGPLIMYLLARRLGLLGPLGLGSRPKRKRDEHGSPGVFDQDLARTRS